ncbi:MAG: LamG-like jellyroll fold domain-containing protein, partial [Nitrosopumilus sp.]
MHRYFLLSLILLFSIGFSSNAFATDDSVFPIKSNFDSSLNYYLIDDRPLTLNQLTINSASDSVLFTDVSSTNPSDDLTYTTETSSPQSMTLSETDLDNGDEIINLLGMLLFAVPFGLLVLRMTNEEPLSKKYLKLSIVIIFLGVGSMMTAQAVAVGNFYWGYAFAELEPDVILPDAIDSLQFDHSDKDNISFQGDAAILEQENPVIHFDGADDYLILDSDLPSKLKSFTVSAWVKPDYADGSAVFSVIGEYNAFKLSINNNLGPEKIATFAVFDGIKWHEVESTSQIDEKWTHLAATFSNNFIQIYVDGVLENTLSLDEEMSITYEYGVMTQLSFDYISSESDVLIGAFAPIKKGMTEIQNYFYGSIDAVGLYDVTLTPLGISELYENNRESDAGPIPIISEPVEIVTEKQGTPNEFGFITDDENPNNLKIEDIASEGFKVLKPEKSKKRPPVANNDSDSVEQGGSVTTDVAANDTDKNNNINLASIIITSEPTSGSVVVNSDGTVTYTHDYSDTTSDSYSYTISDFTNR